MTITWDPKKTERRRAAILKREAAAARARQRSGDVEDVVIDALDGKRGAIVGRKAVRVREYAASRFLRRFGFLWEDPGVMAGYLNQAT